MPFEIRRVRAGTTAVTGIDGDRLRIGRGTNVDLAFDDAAVALEHAVIERDGAVWTLVDQGSVTGTWVNGRRIDTTRLAPEDVIEVGDHRLKVVETGETGTVPTLVLEVEVREEVESREPVAAAAVPPVDYAAAYRLRQGWLSKAMLSLVAVIVAAVAVSTVIALGRTTAFRPGPLSDAHTRAPEIGPRDCGKCHRPWRGPADASCIECHTGHPIHQPTQASTPACGSCHTEHRRLTELQQVPDAACVSCHRDLQAKEGAEPRFAERVTDFGTDHPEWALTVRRDGEESRLPLSDPRARHSDPATLKLNHRLHLKPGLLGAEGRVPQLKCTACHEPGGEDGHLRALSFEAHCERCHQLGFDPTRPTERAPHEDPQIVNAYLLAVYLRDPELDALSLEERRRMILENPGRIRRKEPSPGVRQQVNQSERFLFGKQCSVCHAVDLSTSPPTVSPVAVTSDWLPHARFPHERHGESLGLACADCHAAAETSTETADVLLPAISECRECHGRGTVPAEAEAGGSQRRVPSACVACHDYHRPETPSAGEVIAEVSPQ